MRTKMGVMTILALTFSTAIAWAQISINGPLTHEYTVEPGRSYEGSIVVQNSGDEAQEIKAYLRDYFFYSDGRVLYETAGSLPRSNALWMTLSPTQVLVPPKNSVSLHFIVQVPDDAALNGTYWSIVLVEPISKSSPESSLAETKPTVGLRQIIRYGIQIVTQVGQTGAGEVKFSELKLMSDKGTRTLVADVENTGDRWLKGAFALDLYDSKGAYMGKFEGERKRMYPQTSVRYSVDLVGVASGSYKALIVVDCGGDDVFGVNVNLVLKD